MQHDCVLGIDCRRVENRYNGHGASKVRLMYRFRIPPIESRGQYVLVNRRSGMFTNYAKIALCAFVPAW
jgi:hypothetical protein